MSEIEVLSVGPMYPDSLAQMQREFKVHLLWQETDREAALARVRERIRGIQCFGPYGASAEFIAALPRLEIIANVGVGVDAIDLGAARQRGIVVTNTPDVLNECVADLALGLTIAALRRIPQGDRFVREGEWLAGAFPLARKVGGKTMGILGYGRIGKAIAQRAEAFGMRIAYHGRHAQPGVAHRYYPRLVDMARDCDVLVVICPGGTATRHLVNAEVLAALGPQGTLINVARGSVVDEEALVRALQSRALGAAALDVYADEPQVPQALRAMDNVILQPHVGSSTHETRKAMADLALDNLRAHFSGKAVPTPVA